MKTTISGSKESNMCLTPGWAYGRGLFRARRLLAVAAAVVCWTCPSAAVAGGDDHDRGRDHDRSKIFLHITRDEIVAGGQGFGTAGAYEKIAGTVEFQIDPDDPRNKVVRPRTGA